MSRRPLLRLNSKEPKHTLIFVTEEDGCRIPQRVRTSSMHQQPMDTGADGSERNISVHTAARYAPPSLSSAGPPLPQREPSPRTPTAVPPPPPRTLDQVRPGPRRQNDYVDSPRWVAHQSHPNFTYHKPQSLQVPERTTRQSSSSRSDVITSQPSAADPPTLLKKTPDHAEPDRPAACDDSIICSQCGKCRCQACTQPRELPRRWLCNNKCECSLQKAVDVCSCMLVVRACFYHCLKDSEGDECSASDDPCACCERPDCCKRWTCLGLASLCLPCLCLYWPLRCGLCCCTAVYNKCSRRGCHCRRDKLPGSKRLLIDSESSST